ncbi:glycosyltransferase [bacterium]|nr:glycosyltransferase [bacterium]
MINTNAQKLFKISKTYLKPMRNVLILTDDNIVNGYLYDLHFVAKALTQQEYFVDILQSNRDSKTNMNSKFNLNYLDTNVNIFTFKLVKIRYVGWVFSILAAYKKLKKMQKSKSYDAIICYSSLFVGLPMWISCNNPKTTLIFRLIDELSEIKSSKIQRHIVKLILKLQLQKVDKIFTLWDGYIDYVTQIAPSSTAKCTNIDFAFDTKALRKPSEEINTFCKLHNISKDKTIACFVGVLYDFSALDEFVDSFREAWHLKNNIQVVIAGTGPKYEVLRHKISENNLQSNVIMTGNLNFQEINYLLNVSHIGLNLINHRAPQNLYSAKLIQYLAAGLAVITTNNRHGQKLNSLHDTVYLVSKTSQTILHLENLLSKRNLAEDGIVESIKDTYCLERLGKKLNEEINAS